MNISGLEDFENKIDKIKIGGSEEESLPGWVYSIFYKYGNDVLDIDDNFTEIEGLEPPMLDETWGLKNNKNSKPNFIDESFAKTIQNIFNDTISCRAKMWRCAMRVAEDGLEYLHEPEGLIGYVWFL